MRREIHRSDALRGRGTKARDIVFQAANADATRLHGGADSTFGQRASEIELMPDAGKFV